MHWVSHFLEGIRMIPDPNSRGARRLVAWYGIYQAAHLALNSLYLLGRLPSFPPPPAGGWSSQALNLFTGIASADLLNALLSLVFVTAYFRRRRSRLWLGTVTLTISMYAAGVFTYGTWTSGAWAGQLAAYLWFYVPFLPVVLLFVFVAVWSIRQSK